MRNKQITQWIAASTVFLAGCAATRQYPVPPIMPATRLVESGQTVATNAFRAPVVAGPHYVLVLSGGGMNGAYTAGVLKGWTASGTRPQFDVVTGISTGALIAPFAFLGPDYDAELERLYTSMRQDNIFRPRLHLLGFDSLVSSDPLAQQIAVVATPKILQSIADAHRQGRRLYAGTTNLDTKSLVVWDLGAIASRNTPESRTLFQKVLLASCSIPGLLPPVPIDVEIDGKRFTELHVDGGVTANVFLQPEMVGIGPNGEQPSEASPASVYVIVAGKLRQTAAPAKRELFSIAGESMNAVLQAKVEGELNTLFMLARYAGADFNLTGIPQDYPTPGSNMSFDQKVMRGLFDEGLHAGKDGAAWRSLPSGLQEERFAKPRSDTRFATVGETLPCESWSPEKIRITLGDGASASTRRLSPTGSDLTVGRSSLMR